MGHTNVMWYTGKFDEAAGVSDEELAALGEGRREIPRWVGVARRDHPTRLIFQRANTLDGSRIS
jgi:hypothetical protein